MAIYMYWHNGTCAGCDFRFHLRDVHAPSLRVTVHQHRQAVIFCDSLRARDDGKGRQNDFVTRLKVQAGNSNFKCHRTVTDCNTIFHATILSPAFFKLTDEASFRGNPTSLQAFQSILNLILTDARLVDWDH